jgi:starch phosphorylase
MRAGSPLAGDTARSCADLEISVVFVTLLGRAGYSRQEIDAEGRQLEQPDLWVPSLLCTPLNVISAVEIERKPVWIRAWLYIRICPLSQRCPIVLLDTDLGQNGEDDRALTGVTRPTG